jgi:hypothetical protein
MAKNKNIESNAPVIRYDADPETFKTIVLKVHKKLPPADDIYANSQPISAGEHDAMIMSQEFPGENFLTVFNNGIPCTMSVSELVRDVMLTVFNQIGLED